ncbi:MAG: nucleoside kinase [Anaerolineae bacterium]|nr:nucleoside kinase [Anaerolineae bacterium]
MTLPSGVVLAAPAGSSIEQIFKAAVAQQHLTLPVLPMAAICNGKLRELHYALRQDARLQPVLLASSDGGRIYRRSLVLLLATAMDELWQAGVSVRYAVPDGGYYCEPSNRPPLSPAELEHLAAHMRHIVTEDNVIGKRLVPLDEARALFSQRGDEDKVRLLEYRTREALVLYSLRGREDYYYGYMVPSTGYLPIWKLLHVGHGFILQYPRQETPGELHPITNTYDRLSQVFAQADEWLEKLGIEDVGRLNRLVTRDAVQELILVTEALHEQHIAAIATRIARRYDQGTQLVLIAGPSSSGKTTFARRLAIQLLAHGLRPFTLEMDMYCVDREKTPRDENGEYDFETLGALNLPLFNEHLIRLMAGEQVQLASFDFYSGRSLPGRSVRLQPRQIIILEGIHGLNPALVPDIPPQKIFRVYVSALTQLNIDMHNRVGTTDVRLLRRIVRDARTRGYSAAGTLARWASVRRGEKRNIFPYQDNADVMFNSALVYELAALRPLAEPLLLQVKPDTPEHIEANRLLAFLQWVKPFNEHQTSLIPDTSLLREFIGGSILEHYHPGEQGEME